MFGSNLLQKKLTPLHKLHSIIQLHSVNFFPSCFGELYYINQISPVLSALPTQCPSSSPARPSKLLSLPRRLHLLGVFYPNPLLSSSSPELVAAEGGGVIPEKRGF